MNPNNQALFDTIKQMGGFIKGHNKSKENWKSIYEFVATYGKDYEYAPLPKHIHKMPKKQCFYNAVQLAITYNLVYVEGYAFIDKFPMPIYHAWCCEKNTNIVIDPTTTNLIAYYGVPFVRSIVLDKFEECEDDFRACTCLLDDHVNDHYLLKLSDKATMRYINTD